MKKFFLSIAFFVTLSFVVEAQTKKIYPVIKNYGSIFEVPFAGDWPDSLMEYKIIAEASTDMEKPDSLYTPLDLVARMYNLHVYGGVQQKNLHIDLVIAAKAIFVVMNNEAYKKKYGVENPNLKIIEEMKKAGIKIYACGQSMMKFGIDPTDLNPNIEPIFSRFTTVSTRQLKGYAFFKL